MDLGLTGLSHLGLEGALGGGRTGLAASGAAQKVGEPDCDRGA